MNLPPADVVDWANIAAWAGGITGVLGSVGAAMWLALRNAAKFAAALPGPRTVTETKVITTDSVAMHQLAATIEASNMVMGENNVLRREEHADRTANRAKLEENTEAQRLLVREIQELRGEVRELWREIVRGK